MTKNSNVNRMKKIESKRLTVRKSKKRRESSVRKRKMRGEKKTSRKVLGACGTGPRCHACSTPR